MGRVWIRLYTCPPTVTSTHAFVVASESGGLSERLGTFLINDETTTFKHLREMIEVKRENGMVSKRERERFFSFLFFLF